MRMEEARDLLLYDEWANRGILDAFEGVEETGWNTDLGASFGSPRATVAHLVSAEWIWLRRWLGESPTAPPEWRAEPTLAGLRAHLDEVESERRAWLGDLAEDDLEGEVGYTLLSGESQRSTLSMQLRHLVNHSTYHRGQLATMLRQLARVPPSTDLVRWDWLRRDPGSP